MIGELAFVRPPVDRRSECAMNECSVLFIVEYLMYLFTYYLFNDGTGKVTFQHIFG